eukprot:sb/3467815/
MVILEMFLVLLKILTNRPEYFSDVSITDGGISDHSWVSCELSFNPLGPKSLFLPSKLEGYRQLDLQSADFISIDAELAATDWDQMLTECEELGDEDGSIFVEAMRDKVFKVVKSYCRLKKIRKDFVDKELKHLTSRRRKLAKRNDDSDKWKTQMDCIIGRIKEHLISRDKKADMKAVGVIKENPKYFYSHVKRKSKVKSSVAPLEREDGSLTVDPLEKAGLLQHQFSSVFSDPSTVGNDGRLGKKLIFADTLSHDKELNIAVRRESYRYPVPLHRLQNALNS